ncbi:10961_t:CDS:2, partial [Paraglomus brasilianum]
MVHTKWPVLGVGLLHQASNLAVVLIPVLVHIMLIGCWKHVWHGRISLLNGAWPWSRLIADTCFMIFPIISVTLSAVLRASSDHGQSVLKTGIL